MALTPFNYNEIINDIPETDVTEIEPSKTWYVDFETGRVRTFIDGDSAIRQFITKSIMTARNRYLIYSDDYGSEVQTLLGQSASPGIIDVEVPRLIRESIIYDDRISDVKEITVTNDGDSVFVQCVVELMDGTIIESDVSI